MKGGEDGAILEAGHPGRSDLIRRIKLPAGHKDAMPTKGKRLTEHDIALLRILDSAGCSLAEWCRKKHLPGSCTGPAFARPACRNSRYYESHRPVCQCLFSARIKLTWKNVVDDRTYMRRVYLDVVGLLPTPQQIKAFEADTRPDKREALVKELLNRNDDYAQHWLTFWNDALRNDYTGTGYITGGRYDITKWLYTSLKANKPYN